MGIVFRLRSAAAGAHWPHLLVRIGSAVSRLVMQKLCGMQGHLILLHYEPNKLSLQCAICGYESEGWEVGRPPAVRRRLVSDPAIRHQHPVRTEPRRALRAVSPPARMAS